MISRTSLALWILVASAAAVDAQSNVRPAPRLVRVPEMGAKYLAPVSPWARRWRPTELDPFSSDYSELAVLLPPLERNDFTHLELGVIAHPRTEFERGPGAVSISRAGWSATIGQRVDDESVFAVTLDAEASFYDFSGAGNLKAGSSDPFNDVYDTRVGVLAMHDPAKSASWFTSVELGLSGEDDADLSDALSLGLVGGMRHQVNDDLSLSIGIIGRTRLEDTPWLFPYIGFDWRIAESLRLTSNGSAVAAVYEITQTVEFELGAEYGNRQFRLNDDSSLPSGVFEDEEITASATLGWNPSHRVSLDLEAGVTLWREFSTFSSDGVKLTEQETAPSEFGAIRLSVTL